ncbi:tubulin binding cofactor C-like domain-containing protein, partial [Pavlovales sp. CCMP2436]
ETRTSFKFFRDATLVRYDGELNKANVELEDLNNCEVLLLDVTSQVTIDRCKDCRILIGPTDGSVFIRDSTSCMISLACHQLRTRATTHCDLFVHTLGPIVETSSGIRFERWNVWYPGQARHFANAKLDPLVNNWNDVYDFN